MLAKTSAALVDTVWYAETILSTTPLCTENSFSWIEWLLRALYPDPSCIKQLRIYHARYLPSFSFPGTTNIGNEPSQSGSTLDGFGSRDLQVFSEAKPPIQLYTQVLNALFPLNLMLSENGLRVFGRISCP